MTVTLDKYTRVLLTVIAVLLFTLSVGLWFEAPTVVSTAQAGRIPDSGLQLNTLIANTDQIADSMTDLNRLLTSGKVKVQVIQPTQKSKSVSVTPKPYPGK